MTQLELDSEDDNISLWMHAKSVFNCQFHSMNTDIHYLALFLHPLSWKLAISQVATGCSFQFMVKTVLSIAEQSRWSEESAKLLVDDLSNTISAKVLLQVHTQTGWIGGRVFQCHLNPIH